SAKGLIRAVGTELPNAWHMHCTRNIITNVKAHLTQQELPKLGDAAEDAIWAAQAAMTAGEFHAAMLRVRQLSEGAAAYMDQIAPSLWAAHAISRPTYGLRTSNMAEQINAAMVDACQQDCVTKITKAVLDRMAAHFQARRAEAAKLEGRYCTAA